MEYIFMGILFTLGVWVFPYILMGAVTLVVLVVAFISSLFA